MKARLLHIFLLAMFLSSVALSQPFRQVPRIPGLFVANEGQWDGDIRYRLTDGVSTLFALEEGLVIIPADHASGNKSVSIEVPLAQASSAVSSMSFHEPSPKLRLRAMDRTGTTVNVGEGSDTSRWRRDVASSSGTTWENVWDGVDVSIAYENEKLIQRVRILPGTDTKRIAFEVNDARSAFGADGQVWHADNGYGAKSEIPTIMTDTLLRFRLPQRIPNDTIHLWTEYATFFPSSIHALKNSLYTDKQGRLNFLCRTWRHSRPPNMEFIFPTATLEYPISLWSSHLRWYDARSFIVHRAR